MFWACPSGPWRSQGLEFRYIYDHINLILEWQFHLPYTRDVNFTLILIDMIIHIFEFESLCGDQGLTGFSTIWPHLIPPFSPLGSHTLFKYRFTYPEIQLNGWTAWGRRYPDMWGSTVPNWAALTAKSLGKGYFRLHT